MSVTSTRVLSEPLFFSLRIAVCSAKKNTDSSSSLLCALVACAILISWGVEVVELWHYFVVVCAEGDGDDRSPLTSSHGFQCFIHLLPSAVW